MQKLLIILFLVLISGCADDVDKTQFDISNQTVLDTKSELMWAHSDNSESLTWQEAVDYCENYRGGGYEDWRMPKRSELQTLIEAKIQKEGDLINITSNLIWASETDDSKAAFCHLANRRCSWMERVISISLRALPVRDTKIEIESVEAAASPVEVRPQTVEQRLQVITLLHKQQLITDEEYELKKAAILDEI
jgi:hypothetical protein